MSIQKDGVAQPAGGAVKIYAAISGVVILLMMSFGLVMRMTQGQILPIGPEVFYQLMTAHGIGMVAIAGLGGSAVMWRFLGKYVHLRMGFAWANLAFFLAGVVFVLLGSIYRSNIKWDLTSALLVLSVFGWSAGVIPAVIDGTIAVNQVMHNTLWVPGHFHLYLLLGCVTMILGFINWLSNQEKAAGFSGLEKTMLWTFAGSAFAYALMFLVSGQASIPRRWAVYLPDWVGYSQVASLFAAGVVVSAMVIILRALGGIAKPARQG